MHAECAGLTYLVDDLDGHPMCGVLSGSARFTDRLTLGYRNAVAVADSPLYAAGDRVIGHEFHRTQSHSLISVSAGLGLPTARDRSAVSDGAVHGGVHASTCTPIRPRCRSAISRFVASRGKL